ncbi:zinc finger protein 800-like isoform 1-T2 [Synchiropus picturatus]
MFCHLSVSDGSTSVGPKFRSVSSRDKSVESAQPRGRGGSERLGSEVEVHLCAAAGGAQRIWCTKTAELVPAAARHRGGHTSAVSVRSSPTKPAHVQRGGGEAAAVRMVKTPRSTGRKSTTPVHREQDGRRADVKTRSSVPPTKSSPQSPGQSPVPTSIKDPPEPQVPAKPLWKPIPPLLPEPEAQQRPETHEQSCQTEELQHGALHLGAARGCVEPGDPPLLQQPLQTSKSGIQQIIECFRSGTSQLKTMLLREVETIFECKFCRSLFRGLPNLITHKEYYCLSRSHEADVGDDRQNLAIKDLLEAIYPRADRPDNIVRLEPIQTTTKAVFQYLTTDEDLARYRSRTPSSRESPVAWESEPVDGAENERCSQAAGSESPSQNRKKRDTEEEAKGSQPEDEGSTSGVEDVTISCCLCGQDFNSRRSIRRHCRKMHQTKLEELRKFTETRTVPTSLLSMVKGPNRDRVKLAIDFGTTRTLTVPTGKSCQVCFKSFATKANVRRHFDEVHRGLRRDVMAPSTSSRPSTAEAMSPKKCNNSSPTRGSNSKSAPPVSTKSSSQNKPAAPQSNTASRCSLCKRNYSSQLMYKRHLRIVHKIYSLKNKKSATVAASKSIQVKQEVAEASDQEGVDDMDTSPSPGDSVKSSRAVQTQIVPQVKEEEVPAAASQARTENSGGGNSVAKMSKLSVGFDFKQLFCKLCKRQFSSQQNLSKHIELHTDGNDIFIKFYRCPLCRYESRRKRDVLRHVTVVHKKSSRYLAKIMPKLESRAVKRQAEAVLNSTPNTKRTGCSIKGEVNGRHVSTTLTSPPSPPLTRKQETSTASESTLSPLLSATRKQQEVSSKQERQQRPASPPITRRSDKLMHQRNSFPSQSANQQPSTRRVEGTSDSVKETMSTEVKVTKNFSLHACDQCGKAFAKKVYLESHKRSHRNAEETDTASRRKGVNTRSKSLIW